MKIWLNGSGTLVRTCVRKLRRADELTAAGKTQEEIAAELDVSAATLYNWRRQYGRDGHRRREGTQGAARAE